MYSRRQQPIQHPWREPHLATIGGTGGMTGVSIGVHIDLIDPIVASGPTVLIVPIDLIGRIVPIVRIARIDRSEWNVRRERPVADGTEE